MIVNQSCVGKVKKKKKWYKNAGHRIVFSVHVPKSGIPANPRYTKETSEPEKGWNYIGKSAWKKDNNIFICFCDYNKFCFEFVRFFMVFSTVCNKLMFSDLLQLLTFDPTNISTLQYWYYYNNKKVKVGYNEHYRTVNNYLLKLWLSYNHEYFCRKVNILRKYIFVRYNGEF